jgi:CDP-diacylglycerol--glycerol-3-phosphate 3-phosphatidyltransferase
LTLVFLYGMFQPDLRWRIIATGAFILGALTDMLDGIAARRMDATTRIGTFLDPLADKFQVLSGFFVLLLRPDLPWGGWRLWVLGSVILILLREILVTGLRSVRVRSSKPLVTSIWGKAKTTVQLITLITAFLLLLIRDFLGGEIPGVIDGIAVGILASALLALISGWDYFVPGRTAKSP